jgi:hypothetical protein
MGTGTIPLFIVLALLSASEGADMMLSFFSSVD